MKDETNINNIKQYQTTRNLETQKQKNIMKRLFLPFFLALLCNVAFPQSDTTAIFPKADSLIKLADSFYDAKKYNEALDLYNRVAEMTKDIEKGNNNYYATALYNLAWLYSDMGFG